MKIHLRLSVAALLCLTSAANSNADDGRFDIIRFQVDGNTLLSDQDIDRAVANLNGPNKSFADIQKAIDSLNSAYRRAGYSAVSAHAPEQELTSGIVHLQIIQRRIANVTVRGNQHFDTANIRSSVRGLHTGESPDFRALSEAIQLANENPSKQIEVTLAKGDKINEIDARIDVRDESPLHTFVTAENTGTPASGKWRTGAALQYGNLFNLDQVVTVAYSTSPDSPRGVRVALWSIGYRLPVYRIGDSADLIYASSSVNTPGTSPTLGGLLGIVGKGDILGARWNHYLARRGDSTSKVVFSIDRKYSNSRCTVGGIDVSFAVPTPPISSCVPYTTMPAGLNYSARRQQQGAVLDFNLGLARNIPLGTTYTNVSGRTDRYSYLTPGNRDTRDHFMLLRGGVAWVRALAGDWQWRVAGNLQLASDPLPASEQFSLAGYSAVRGFEERAVASDSGAILNAEIFTPDLAGDSGVPGKLRALAFYDLATGANRNTGTSATPVRVRVASAGLGLRYSAGRHVDLRADVARVGSAGTATTASRGDWKGHFGVVLGF